MPSLRSLALALCLLPACLAAQESSTDSSAAAFHAGQWAVQFGSDLHLANVGILKFTSPRTAWMLQLDFGGQGLSGTSFDQLGTGTDFNAHQVFVGTGVGRRFYQTARRKIRSFQSIT